MKKRCISEKEIKREIHTMYAKLIEKRPSHFSRRDIANAFFGAFLVGVAFVLKGSLVRTAELFTEFNIIALILATIIVLTAEIYFIGYTRVVEKSKRHFCQFWFKRFVTLFLVAFVTSGILTFIYGVNHTVSSQAHLINIIIALAFPCAIGAAVPSLMKQY